MRMIDVLRFASEELTQYLEYKVNTNTFYSVTEQSIKNELINVKALIDNALQNHADNETKLNSVYCRLYSDLKHHIKHLSKRVSFPNNGQRVEGELTSTLACHLRQTLSGIEAKYEAVQAVSARMLEEECKSKELALTKQEMILKQQKLVLEQTVQLLSANLSSMPAELQKQLVTQLRQLNVIASPDGGVQLELTFEEPVVPVSSSSMASSSQSYCAIEEIYLPDNTATLTQPFLQNHPYEGAKLAFKRAMSPQHALAATFIYFYLFESLSKPTDRRVSSDEYDRGKDLGINEHISISIFYLFFEMEKSWKQICDEIDKDSEENWSSLPKNPLSALFQQAKTNQLELLTDQLKKVYEPNYGLGDIVPQPDQGKTQLESVGKYSAMFFAGTSIRHAAYCHKLYKGQPHDQTALEELYQLPKM